MRLLCIHLGTNGIFNLSVLPADCVNTINVTLCCSKIQVLQKSLSYLGFDKITLMAKKIAAFEHSVAKRDGVIQLKPQAILWITKVIKGINRVSVDPYLLTVHPL